MIRKIQIELNAAHPELPLVEATTFVGSPSAVFVRGIPPSVGSWRITTVKVVATYPDNSAHTVECVKGADGVFVATIPETDTSGRVAQGLQILADGIDERGEAVTGYVLGIADLAVYLRDMTISGAEGVKYYAHLVDSIPEHPQKGDLANFDGVYKLYDGTTWVSLGADIAAQYAEEARLAKVAAETAQGKAEAAETAAVNAKVDAIAAKNAAESAKVDAVAAKGSAESASAAAVLAKTAAETAQGKAETAQGKAEAAETAAVNAKADAIAAKTAAETAKVDAVAAKGSAESASADAVAAKTAAETAQGKAETAQGKAETAQTAAEAAQAAAEAATSQKVTIDPVFENTMSEIFSMDTDLAECATTQDVAIVKLTQLLGEDVSAYPVPAAA